MLVPIAELVISDIFMSTPFESLHHAFIQALCSIIFTEISACVSEYEVPHERVDAEGLRLTLQWFAASQKRILNTHEWLEDNTDILLFEHFIPVVIQVDPSMHTGISLISIFAPTLPQNSSTSDIALSLDLTSANQSNFPNVQYKLILLTGLSKQADLVETRQEKKQKAILLLLPRPLHKEDTDLPLVCYSAHLQQLKEALVPLFIYIMFFKDHCLDLGVSQTTAATRTKGRGPLPEIYENDARFPNPLCTPSTVKNVFAFLLAQIELLSVPRNPAPPPGFMDVGFHLQQRLILCMGASVTFPLCANPSPMERVYSNQQ
ncbi:hypothetical protein Anapl_13622 [Anas platyrhynchos]|uniref:Uncharacterized protein n=1 Tax=Anas platyrhynchos TaxID=8839 RepID=R0KFH2_ANAPL|nr:hypothetical protein Anapl_13622 [Anas platyrhynchos]